MKIGPNLTVMNSREVKELMKLLNNEFGVSEKFSFAFLRNNKDKVYVINKDIDDIDYSKLRIDSAGLYFGTFQLDGFRLSIEGSQLVAKFATKNVLELTREQKHEWLKGNNVELPKEESRLVIVKWKDDVLGCGKVKNETLLNTVPKARRLIVVNE